jgi:hypothetical protein
MSGLWYLAPRGDRNRWLALGVAALLVVAALVGVGAYFATKNSNHTAATATVPGLAPFVGQWSGGHSGKLDIHSDGSGRWTYEDRSTCPNAPLVGCGITGTTVFTLASVANGTARGSVTTSSDPTNGAPVGGPVTIVLGSANGTGVVLAVSIGKMQGWNFCNDTSPHYCAEG